MEWEIQILCKHVFFSGKAALMVFNRNAKGVNGVACQYKGVNGVLLVS